MDISFTRTYSLSFHSAHIVGSYNRFCKHFTLDFKIFLSDVVAEEFAVFAESIHDFVPERKELDGNLANLHVCDLGHHEGVFVPAELV